MVSTQFKIQVVNAAKQTALAGLYVLLYYAVTEDGKLNKTDQRSTKSGIHLILTNHPVQCFSTVRSLGIQMKSSKMSSN